jgi:hypothetical protein
MVRTLRVVWLMCRGLLGVFFLAGLVETVQGAPHAAEWLADAGVAESRTLGVILAAIVLVIVGLVALGPVRVKHWLAVARGHEPAQTMPSRQSTSSETSKPMPLAERERDALAAAQARSGAGDLMPRRATGLPANAPQIVHVPTSHYQAGELAAQLGMTPLERWLHGRIEIAETAARERVVRGDREYLEQMGKWDTENVSELGGLNPETLTLDRSAAIAMSLVDEYRADPRDPDKRADGIEPPHTVALQEAYFERRVEWLRKTLRALRGDAAEETRAAEGSGLDGWLAEHSREIGSLKQQLAAMLTVGSTFYPLKAQTLERHFWKIAEEVHRRLAVDAPAWADYFEENPTGFPEGLTILTDDQFRRYTLPAMDATINQIAHIRAELSGERRSGRFAKAS